MSRSRTLEAAAVDGVKRRTSYRLTCLAILLSLLAAACGSATQLGSTNSADDCTAYLSSPEAEREALVAEIGAEHQWSMASNPLAGYRTVDSICANSTGFSPTEIIINLACDEGSCGSRDAEEAEIAAEGGFVGSGFFANGLELPASDADEICSLLSDGLIADPFSEQIFGRPERLGSFWDDTLSEEERARYGDIEQFVLFLNHVKDTRCQAGGTRYVAAAVAEIYNQFKSGVQAASGRTFDLDAISRYCEVRDIDRFLTIPMLRTKEQVLTRWEEEQDSLAEEHLENFDNWIYFLNTVAAQQCPEFGFADDGTPIQGPVEVAPLVVEGAPGAEIVEQTPSRVVVELGFAPWSDSISTADQRILDEAIENFSPLDADLIVEIVAFADSGIEPNAALLAEARAVELDSQTHRPVAGTTLEVVRRSEVVEAERGGLHPASSRAAVVTIFERGTEEYSAPTLDVADFVGEWTGWPGGSPLDISLSESGGSLVGTFVWPQNPCEVGVRQVGQIGDSLVLEATAELGQYCNDGPFYYLSTLGSDNVIYGWSTTEGTAPQFPAELDRAE